MNRHVVFALLLIVSCVHAQGPDVIVGDIPAANSYGSVNNVAAFSLATTSCNIGTQVLAWDALPALTHPVIGQEVYRIRDGVFTQVGVSWLKHGFAALNNSLCGPCNPTPTNTLGIGCSDPYGAGLNGQQSNLGPRSEVNAFTGVFPIPGGATVTNNIDRRLQIHHDDINPGLNQGAVYLAEVHYVTQDDAAAGNHYNNQSWRPCSFAGTPANGYNLAMTGSTTRQKAAIEGWQTYDANVELIYVDVPNEGRFIVGYNRISLPAGGFRHVIAVENVNSDRGAQGLNVSFPLGSSLSNASFHKVDHHSGEPYSTANWTATIAGPSVSWQNDAPYSVNQNANALRWGMCNTFIIESNSSISSMSLDLFKPGTPASVSIPVSTNGGWQMNQAGAHFDIDGIASSANAPIFVDVLPGTLVTANINATAVNAPWDLGMTAIPPQANVGITQGGQIINVNLFDPSFIFLFNMMQGTSIPAGGMSLPFPTPSTVNWEWAAQMVVADPSAPDGFWFSAPVDFHSRTCGAGTQTLSLADDNFIQVGMGPGTSHSCASGITFAGATFTTIAVNSNGSVTFGPGDSDFSPSSVEFINGPRRLAGMWSDLAPNAGGTVSVTSSTGGLVSVSFNAVPESGNSGATSTFSMNFDTASGSCSIFYQGSAAHGSDTLVGLNPGPGSTSTPLNWSALANQPAQSSPANAAVYQLTSFGAPSGFTLISFPNSDPTLYMVF